MFVGLFSELKERLKPELLELIRQQRLNRLCQGTMFRKISSRRRQGESNKNNHSWTHSDQKTVYHLSKHIVCSSSDKLWYCRLSPNHKMLHFGDVEEDTENPPIEMLQEKSEFRLGFVLEMMFRFIHMTCVHLFSLCSSSSCS